MYIHYDYKSGILFERPDWSTGFLSLSFSEIILGNHKTSVFWCGASHKKHVSNLKREVTEIPLKWMGISCKKKKGIQPIFFFFSEVKFRSKADLWPLETVGLLRFIEEEPIWGSFSFSNNVFKFQFLHVLWKQNVRQSDKEEKINCFKLSTCWERNPGGEMLKGRIEAVWCLNMFIFNSRAI